MKNVFLILILAISTITFSQSKKINYDFSCMEEDGTSFFINLGSDFEKEILKTLGDSVSAIEEIILGDTTLAQMKREHKISQSGIEWDALNKILLKLTPHIKNPKGFKYQIYIMENKELNAFTVGGKIFFTTGMYKFCKNVDEMACIIGHEIAHNELGHINENISRIKTANNFGTVGQMSASVGTLVTTSFNQKNEAHSDFVGIDLAVAAGYNGCASVDLWQRMKTLEGEYRELNSFFSTHPYSGKRSECSKNHLKTNYSKVCTQ